MICPSCKLDHDLVREACKKSLWMTAKLLCGVDIMNKTIHRALTDFVESGLENGKRHFLILMPRGHLKTSICTVANTVWHIIKNPDVRILIVHASATKASEFLKSIKGVLTADMFLHYFPELDPRKAKEGKWSEDKVDVPHSKNFPESTITSVGVTSTVTGGHYDIHIFDDLIDENIASSQTEMQNVIEFFRHSPPLFDTLKSGVRFVIGTRWAKYDLYGLLLEAGDHEVFDQFKRCIGSDGTPIWPERFTSEDFEAVRRTMSPRLFSAQYYNEPIEDEMVRFRPEDIQYYTLDETGTKVIVGDERILISSMYRTMCVDPSLGESLGSDESAITVCGVDDHARIFILEAWAARVRVPQLIEKIFVMQKRWKPNKVGIEDVGFQRALQYYMRKEMSERGVAFTLDPLKSGGKKKSIRIEGLTPYFANRQVWMQRSQTAMLRQLLDFTPLLDMPHDDLIDSLAYHTVFWKRGSTFVTEEDEIEDWTDISDPGERGKAAYGLAPAD